MGTGRVPRGDQGRSLYCWYEGFQRFDGLGRQVGESAFQLRADAQKTRPPFLRQQAYAEEFRCLERGSCRRSEFYKMLSQLLTALKESPITARLAERDRRTSERVPAQEPAVLRWKDHLALDRSLEVTVVNVSSGGVAFSGSEHLNKGQLISVETTSRTLECVVRHVRATSRGYYMGAEVLSSSAGRGMLASIKKLAMEKHLY